MGTRGAALRGSLRGREHAASNEELRACGTRENRRRGFLSWIISILPPYARARSRPMLRWASAREVNSRASLRARCARLWATASRVGLTQQPHANGTGLRYQWWAAHRHRRPLGSADSASRLLPMIPVFLLPSPVQSSPPGIRLQRCVCANDRPVFSERQKFGACSVRLARTPRWRSRCDWRGADSERRGPFARLRGGKGECERKTGGFPLTGAQGEARKLRLLFKRRSRCPSSPRAASSC